MKVIHTIGTRKKAKARATLSEGKGIVRVNKILLENIPTSLARLKVKEPLIIAGDVASKVDIEITVSGGGRMGQADAVRLAVARALVEYTKSDELKDAFSAYDWTLFVADVRQREPRKPNRHGNARGKTQKSYR